VILELTLDDDTIATYLWRSDQRLPVVGEHLAIGIETFQVERVTWYLQVQQQQGTIPATRAVLAVRKANP